MVIFFKANCAVVAIIIIFAFGNVLYLFEKIRGNDVAEIYLFLMSDFEILHIITCPNVC